MAITLTHDDVVALNQLRRSRFADGVQAVLIKQLAEHRRVYEQEPANEANRIQLDLTKTVLHLLYEVVL
jgi:hypothetical protein